MITVTVDGKKIGEFQNMAQALAFAYQNGECHNAKKVEIAKNTGKAQEEKPEKEGGVANKRD